MQRLFMTVGYAGKVTQQLSSPWSMLPSQRCFNNFFFWIVNLRSSRDSLGKVQIFPFEFPALNENGNPLINKA